MEILWTTVFLDLGADVFEAGVEFWSQALASEVSTPRGPSGEFATLEPPEGDAYVRVQRTSDGTSGIHLDLHVRSPHAASDVAVRLGATVVADHGYVIMRSPAGLLFCFLEHHGESDVPGPGSTHPHRLDQLCIDVAPDVFDQECAFWSSLTEWELAPQNMLEFRSLVRPAGIPLRFLLQRLDDAPTHRQPHAHLDIACGDHIDAVAERHVALGATTLGRTKVWMQMRDPAGLLYCLTPRSA